MILPPLTVRAIQRKLDCFRGRGRGWHNEHRPHAALGGRTPEELHSDAPVRLAAPIRQRDQLDPLIQVRCEHCRDDPYLPVIKITLRLGRAA